ncbi:MAG: NADAR family protein [Lachnospiraceae bacterium]|nr:NADAR family protein [Lachnospiraceae bacterium]
MKAAEMGRNRDLPLREDWEQIKDNIMRKAVCAKFTQNIDIKDILISTGRETIIEKQPMITIGDVERMVLGKICWELF